MTELNTVVNTTLLADYNQATISAMLDAILAKPLTPMEAKQAKTYMEQVATQAAGEEGTEVQLFQLMEMKLLLEPLVTQVHQKEYFGKQLTLQVF